MDKLQFVYVEDVVCIVRCKDCANRPRLNERGTLDYGGDCPCATTGDPYYDYMPDDDWYCANGVRRVECDNEPR